MCPWKSLNFLFKKGYEPCRFLSRGGMDECMHEFAQSTATTMACRFHIGLLRSEPTWVHKFWVTHLDITSHSDNSWNAPRAFLMQPFPPPPPTNQCCPTASGACQANFGLGKVWGDLIVFFILAIMYPWLWISKHFNNFFASDIVASEKILLWNLIIPWSKDTNSVSIAYICQ